MLQRGDFLVTAAAGLLTLAAVASSRIGVTNVLVLAVLITAGIAIVRGRLSLVRAARPLWLPLLAFSAATVLSSALSLDPLTSAGTLHRLLVFALVPLAAVLVNGAWWPRLLTGLAAATSVLAVWGIQQYLQGANHLGHRIRGPLSHYMTYSGWLLLAVLVLLAALVLGPRRRWWWLAPAAALGAVAIVLSLTRNAWVGLAAGVLLLAVVWRRRVLWLYPAAALALWLFFPGAVMERAVSTFDLGQHANYDRMCMVVSGGQMIRDHPWTGVGPDMVPRVYPLYRRDDAPRWRVPHLHNNPVQIAAERGIPALIAYGWLLGAFFVAAWRRLATGEGEGRTAAAAALVAVAGISVAGLFEYNFWDAEIQYLTLILMGVGMGEGEAV